ncbi:retrovirus-related pol polyprotein from transposon TNT 1-94 [Tanacetum coccineum]
MKATPSPPSSHHIPIHRRPLSLLSPPIPPPSLSPPPPPQLLRTRSSLSLPFPLHNNPLTRTLQPPPLVPPPLSTFSTHRPVLQHPPESFTPSSMVGTITVSETEPTTPSIPTEVKNTEKESKINELTKLVKKLINEKRHTRKPIWYMDSGCSRSMTGVKSYLHKYVEQPGPKVVFGDNSSCITEGYGSINCEGITFTKVAFVNGLKNIVLIAPRRNDVYVLNISSLTPNGACFFAKASESVNWLWHKRLSHLNFKNINKLAKQKQAERKNRTLIKAARTMLNGLLLSKNFWTETVKIARYTQNRLIIVKRHNMDPYEIFKERIHDISYFLVFGCPVFIHNHKDHLGKFDAKADDGYFLGYSFNSKAFRA